MTIAKEDYAAQRWAGLAKRTTGRPILILFVITALSRLPWQSAILYHWDSVNFAFAVERFDLALDQPQPPGYILYVGLVRLLNSQIHDPQTTMVWLSLLSNAAAVVVLYYLGKALFSPETGLMAALFLAVSPLFWFYGEIALPHALDMLAVIGIVWLLQQVGAGNKRQLIPAVVGLAIAGGLRPQTQVFLIPLACLAARRVGWRQGLLALGVMGLVDLGWLVPLVQSVGGPAAYADILGNYAGRFNESSSVFSSGWQGLSRNLRKLTMYTMYGWGLVSLPTVVYSLIYRHRLAIWFKRPRFWFLIFWIAPSAGYYTLVHMGQPGLVFIFLPALLLVSAELLRRLLENRPALRWIMVGAMAAVHVMIFLVAPAYPLGSTWLKLLTRDTIGQHDRDFQTRLTAVAQNFPADRTVIMANQWRYLQYYLPDYPLLRFNVIPKWETGEGRPEVSQTEIGWFRPGDLLSNSGSPSEEVYLVLFDDNLTAFLETPNRVRQLRASSDLLLNYLVLEPTDIFYLEPEAFGVQPELPE